MEGKRFVTRSSTPSTGRAGKSLVILALLALAMATLATAPVLGDVNSDNYCWPLMPVYAEGPQIPQDPIPLDGPPST